ncbi:hypothetical protein Tco_0149381 [Tanacetum coccineum]
MVPQPISPTQTPIADTTASIGMDVKYGGDTTTVTGLEAGQGSGNIDKTPTMPHDSPLLRVNTLGSDEGSMTLQELMVFYITLSKKMESLETDLKQTKKIYGAAYTRLIKKVHQRSIARDDCALYTEGKGFCKKNDVNARSLLPVMALQMNIGLHLTTQKSLRPLSLSKASKLVSSMRARKFFQRTGKRSFIEIGTPSTKKLKTTEIGNQGSSSIGIALKFKQKHGSHAFSDSEEEKKTAVPTATKKESVKTVNPSRRSVSFHHIQYNCPNAYKHMVPRAVLMKTGLKTVKNAKPLSTVRSVNTARPFSTASSVSCMGEFNDVKPSACWESGETIKHNGASLWMIKAHVWILAHLSDFKDFDGGYVILVECKWRSRITGKGTIKTDKLLFGDVYFVKS